MSVDTPHALNGCGNDTYDAEALSERLFGRSPLGETEKQDCRKRIKSKVYSDGNHLVRFFQGLDADWKALFANQGREPKGSPAMLVVTSSAVRAVEVIRDLSQINKACKISKLFSKHFKLNEQAEYLSEHSVCVGVGTPSRLSKLVEMGALNMTGLRYLTLDMTKDAKQNTIVDIKETNKDLWQFFMKHCQSLIENGTLQLVVICKCEKVVAVATSAHATCPP